MIYVDNAKHPFGRMIMCHMIADSHAELIEMAKAIGVNVKWIQQENSMYEHFDICLSMKMKAITLGAKQITQRQSLQIIYAKAGKL